MEEPDSSGSDQENHSRDVHHHVTSKLESDESYSDSDSDETKEPQSMLNIYKPGHVPGKYKQSIEPETEKHSACIAEVESLDGHSDENSEATEEPTDSQKDVSAGVEIQEKTEGEEGAQQLSVEMESNFAETGIFGKSMCVIPSMLAEEQSIKEDDMILSKPRPPVPPKPSLDIYNPAEPVVKVDSGIESPDNRPKPKPRKSKTPSGTYSDEQLLLTDELPAKKVSPMPSPRTKRKSEETEVLSSTGNEPENFEKSEKKDKQRTDSKEISTTTDEKKGMNNDEETVSDSTVETVDIGSAKDLVFDDSSLNILSEKQEITENFSHLHQNDDTLTSCTVVNNENINFQQSVARSSFEVINTEEAMDSPRDREGDNMLSEENDSDNEETARFVNDFQDTDSGKGDMVMDQNISDSEPEGEFRTPDNHSEDEGEADVFYDSKLTHSVYIKQKPDEDVEKDEIESTKMDKAATDDEEPFGDDKFLKGAVLEKVKAFEDSVVVIGKGTIKEAGYDSLSSTVSSGDLTTVTLSADMKIGEEKEEKKSLFGKITMFESLASGKSKNGNQPDFEKSRRNFASGSSFEILSSCSEDSELKSDTFSANPEKHDFEVEESAEINTDTDVPRPTGPKSNTVWESDATGEPQAIPNTYPETPTDVNSETESEHLLDDDHQSPEQSIELNAGYQDDNERSKGDSMQDQMPPPIAPKSERVLDSLWSLAVERAPNVPPRSLTLETEGKEHDKVNYETNVQGQKLKSSVVCEEDFLPDTEHASPSQGEHIPAKSPSEEEHTSQQHQRYDHQQSPEHNIELNAGHQDDYEGSEGDSMQDQMPPPIAPKSELVLDSLRSLAIESSPNVQPRSLTLETEGNEEHDKVNYETNVQSQKLESFVICGEEFLPDTEHASPSQGEHIPAKSPSEEEHLSQQYQSYDHQQMPQYQQQQQMPSYPNFPYEQQQQQQQQQQTPPMWTQPYYYLDQSGNIQYTNPYAFYNPNMNPGMFYQNPNMQYYQQPYFSHQNYGNPYGQAQERKPAFSSHTPTRTDENDYEEVGESAREEYGRSNDEGSYEQTSKRDSDYGPRTEAQPENGDYTQIRKPTSSARPKSFEHADNRHGTKEDRRKSYGQEHYTGTSHKAQRAERTKSESAETIKETAEKDNASPSVQRSTSMPSNTPHGKRTSRGKEAKKNVRRRLKEDVPEDHEEAEDYFIYFKGINPDTRNENLANFVEVTTHGEVDSNKVIFDYSRTCALVTVSLTQKPDMHSIEERIQKRGIDTKKPEVYEVQSPGSIAVSCEEDISNPESLGLYFESRRVGDAEIKQEPYESEDGSCFVVEFGDPKVVKRVCAMKTPHVWENKRLRVSPYFECKAGSIWNSELHVLKIPEPAVVTFQPNYFIILQRKCCEELLANLQKNHCNPIFTEEGLRLECTLTPKTTGFKGLAKDWEESSRRIVDNYIAENIIERTLQSSEQVWGELVEFFKSENIQVREDVVATCDSSGFVILLIGFNSPVKDLLTKLKGKHAEIEKRLNRKTETVWVDSLKLRLLDTIGFFQDLKREIEDTEVYIGDGEVTIEGQPDDISFVRVKLYDVDNQISITKWSHGFSNDCVDFVERKLLDKISTLLKSNNLTAVWKIDMRDIEVCAFEGLGASMSGENDYEVFDEDHYSSPDDRSVGKNAKELLKSAITEMQETVQDSIIEVLTSPEWVSFLENMTETYEEDAEIEFKESLGKIVIYGMKKETDLMHKKMKDFLDENAIRSETIQSGTINVRFIQMHRKDFVERLEKKFEPQKVKIELQDDCVNIRGNKKGISEAKKEFKIFFDAIQCEKYTIQKVAVKDVFRDEKEQGTIAIVEKETSCLIKLPGENATFMEQASIAGESEDSDDGYEVPISARGATGTSQDGFGSATAAKPINQGFKAPNGVKVNLVKGELGQKDGNVIVVTTSPNLNLSSGNACKSVLKAGGKKLQDQCKENYPNGIEFGEIAVIDGGGSLECNKVYLTTLPNWNSDHNPRQVLEKVMKDSLELASKYKMYSIIFCAMGTGQLKYPTDLVAMIMYQAVIDFDLSHPQTTLKEVSFVLYQKDYSTIKAFEEEERLRLEGGGERPTFDLKAGNMTIELSVENIAQQKVDGILCSTSPNMDLSRNGACQALLRAGGNTLQDECKAKYSNKLEEGNVVEIGGGKLSCKSVFLTVLPGYNADAISILTKVIQTLLQLAQAKSLKSLALPALGTGFLRYPKDEVCKCMFETVIEWSQKNPNSSLQNVRFIMHAKDHAVIQRFKSYILNARGRGRRESRHSTIDPKYPGSRPKTAAPAPRQTSFYNAHPDGVHIGKIKLSVFKDDILSQKTDAVVSSVGKDFEFLGAVALELKKKCPKMEPECNRKDRVQKLHTQGVVMTKGFELRAKYVIHVRYAEKLDEWQDRFRKCLEKANKKSLKTIAFPVLGTGKGFTTFHPEAIAGCMFDAIDDFMKANRNPSIKDIRLIVYKGQPTMFTPIMDKLHKKVQDAATASGKDGSLAKIFSKTFAKYTKKAIAAVSGKEEGTISEQDMQKILQETSSMEIQIYSDSKTNIEKCKKELDAKLEKLYTKKKIENYKEIVKSLKQEEMQELDVIALANINIDPQSGVITIEGPTKQVSDVTHELQMKLLKLERKRHDIKSAEELFKLVQWQYEEVTMTEFKLIPYNKTLNQKIEHAYKANKSAFEFEDDDGDEFVIDFKQLIEYRKSDDQDKLRVLRKDILKSAASALPEEWAAMKDNENIKVVSIPNTDQTYLDISNRFLTEVKTGSYAHRLNFNPNNLQVNKIERIQNKTLYQQYQAKRRQMTEQKPNLPANMPIERELWHGTKYDAVTSIQMHGFNRSYSGNANGDPWYGEGVYFAGNASYSARGWLSGAGAGSKGYMFLVKTLSGQMCQGKKGMRYLPAVDTKDPTILYDCAVDNLQNPMEFVIFNDTQAYPAYIITFTT
ncbi:protein mono-ADP-ribosyltransferase PARP14-like [Mercenaria mercenaria]|uniref:protein mono-ADP-ribosyltransferase PARP14-like n=1 Tax=Mercenaria mercenaria TaxID=6596 RepID=UPI00234F261D|nr:protein mono-ADP-ribosyltransferase PARP14-like [Mercenaria mercenaria]